MDMVWPGLAVEVRREGKGKHPWPHLSPSPSIHVRHGLPVEAYTARMQRQWPVTSLISL